VDGDAEAGQRLDEAIVLAPGPVELDGAQEAAPRHLERPAKRRPGRAHKDFGEIGRHRLGAERPLGQRHRRSIARWSGFTTKGREG
jgi:hypothetical protein